MKSGFPEEAADPPQQGAAPEVSSKAEAATSPTSDAILDDRPCARHWEILSGLIVSGFLLALPGGLLPLWGYHISPEFGTAGNYFLALGAGMGCGGYLAQRLAMRMPLDRLLAAGSAASAMAMILVACATPPAQVWFQALSLFFAGAAAGSVNTAVLEALSPAYEANPASTTLAGGIFFGAGSILAAVVTSRSFGEGGIAFPLLWSALAPIAAAGWMMRRRIAPVAVAEVTLEQAVRDLRSGLAVIFALLLFFQFANEWLIAGWLPVLLIDRHGMSPTSAASLLAVYWFALTAGRITAANLLNVVRHGRLLGLSAFSALFGCSLIAFGSNLGVVVGVLLTGLGFSAIYPLAAERIAGRFSYYHPGYFNGIFTFALMGGVLSPFVMGHIAMSYGLSSIPLTAMLGSCAVFALVLVIWRTRSSLE